MEGLRIEKKCSECLHGDVDWNSYPCSECYPSNDREMWEDKNSKECMTCWYGQAGFLPDYCGDCHNFSKHKICSRLWGLRTAPWIAKAYMDEEATPWDRDSLIEWMKKRGIKEPEKMVKDGHEKYHSISAECDCEIDTSDNSYDCGDCNECGPAVVGHVNGDGRKTIHNTNIEQKRKYFGDFVELLQNQFEHGGSKYAGNEEAGKEFTDIICEAFPGESGVDFVLSTCMKYLGRIRNFKREKDTLKVACYMYILWLKLGFFKNVEHDEDIFVR